MEQQGVNPGMNPQMQTGGANPQMQAGGVKKKAPAGAIVIAVLHFITALGCLAGGIAFLVGGALFSTLFPIAIAAALFYVLGAVAILLAVLFIFMGIGLIKVKNWARIVSIVFGCLGIILSVYYLVTGTIGSGIVGLVINGFVAGYLLFSGQVKQAFSK